MLSLHNICHVKILTDCNDSSVEDLNEVTLIKVNDLREMYYDLKESSSVVLQPKRLTAVSKDRLLSILILNESLFWSDIIDDRRQSTFYY